MKAEIDSIESLKEEHLETMQASVSISDLPSGVLEHILLSSCVTFNPEKCRDVVSMPQVKTLSSVCTKWHAVMLSSCERASHGPPRNPTRAQAGLRELRTLRNTTHVSASDWSNDSDTGFFRELASGFPLLTSFHLKLFGSYKVLDRLSSLLSLQTNIQELSVMFNNGMDLFLHGSSGVNGRRRRYWAALEGMDFASQAHLKRLTLDYMVQFPEEISYKRCFPVSPTIAQLAGLEELRIGVMAWVAPLPSWLVKLPALAGLTILDEWRERTSLLAVLSYVAGADFQRSLAGLRDLTLGAVEVCASEMDLLSTMGKLTALKLDLDPPSESPSTPRGDALLLLSPTLRKLSITGNLIPQNARPLPLLEDLTLAVQAAIQLDYFAFTPNLRKLDMVLTKGVARPHLGRVFVEGLGAHKAPCGEYHRHHEGDVMRNSLGEGQMAEGGGGAGTGGAAVAFDCSTCKLLGLKLRKHACQDLPEVLTVAG
eukprot:jgi/Mesen1/6605/ME000338S05775